MAQGESDAPEVAITPNYPIPLPEPSGFHNAQQTYLDVQTAEKTAPYYSSHELTPLSSEPPRHRSRKWIIGVPMLVALVALGAGIGIGYAVGKNASAKVTPPSAASSCPGTQTVTVSPSSTLSSTSSAVTSGTTGIAAFSCNATSSNTYTTASNPSATFAEECFTDYPGGYSVWDSSTATVADLAAKTVYTFESCMDQCVRYNANSAAGGRLCEAVTYDANLTATVQANAGNCWLKTARGVRYNGNRATNYGLVASAYVVGAA